MENKENAINKINKVTETLIKELEGLSEDGLHEFFMFFYKMNHQHGNKTVYCNWREFISRSTLYINRYMYYSLMIM